MPSLKDLKNRIGSVKSTQKITSAMKMVAAAKLRKAQEQAIASRPYCSSMEKIVRSLASKLIDNAPELLKGKKEIKKRSCVRFWLILHVKNIFSKNAQNQRAKLIFSKKKPKSFYLVLDSFNKFLKTCCWTSWQKKSGYWTQKIEFED